MLNFARLIVKNARLAHKPEINGIVNDGGMVDKHLHRTNCGGNKY